MRDRETIDSELRLIALARRTIREQGGKPSYREADALLDERLGHRPETSEAEAVEGETEVVAGTSHDLVKTGNLTLHRRRTALRRFGLLMALPLSVLAVATVLVVMFVLHTPHPSAQPTETPPPAAPSETVAPQAPAPPQAQAPPQAPPPPLDVVDMAFIAALKHDGLPVPSHEYVMTHGHAVCDFLAHQPNIADAVRFVQQSSIWDANQSVNFTAGAVVSYCPQYETASPDEMNQAYQKALTDLQAIQGNLQGIQGNLQGIQDGLPAIPGHQ